MYFHNHSYSVHVSPIALVFRNTHIYIRCQKTASLRQLFIYLFIHKIQISLNRPIRKCRVNIKIKKNLSISVVNFRCWCNVVRSYSERFIQSAQHQIDLLMGGIRVHCTNAEDDVSSYPEASCDFQRVPLLAKMSKIQTLFRLHCNH